MSGKACKKVGQDLKNCNSWVLKHVGTRSAKPWIIDNYDLYNFETKVETRHVTYIERCIATVKPVLEAAL